jgi:hypothetical protein
MPVPPSLPMLAGLAAVAVLASAGTARAADPQLRAELDAASRRTVLFGHQSVGNDILAGLRDLADQEGVPLRIAEVTTVQGLAPATWAHVLVAENGNPVRKLQSFGRALGDGQAPVDVALVKFCYVDLLAGGDAKALFQRYQEELRALQARHPRTTFVRATVPLTAIPTGPKAFVKRMLGRDRNREDDARREEFNALVRTSWQGPEPLFDLARFESTRPDGRAETCEVGGRQVPALVPAYTHDGGHLNEVGRRRVARELVRLLAALPRREVAAAEGAAR